MEKATSIEQVFEAMEARLNPDAAAGVDAVFQFDLSGDNGGQYWVKVADQKAEVHEGTSDNPTITVLANADDYLKVINGELAPMSAFMQGKVKVKGDMGMAMKLQSLFEL